jgi:hypothetical protein
MLHEPSGTAIQLLSRPSCGKSSLQDTQHKRTTHVSRQLPATGYTTQSQSAKSRVRTITVQQQCFLHHLTAVSAERCKPNAASHLNAALVAKHMQQGLRAGGVVPYHTFMKLRMQALLFLSHAATTAAGNSTKQHSMQCI